jgi:hypothetical protein
LTNSWHQELATMGRKQKLELQLIFFSDGKKTIKLELGLFLLGKFNLEFSKVLSTQLKKGNKEKNLEKQIKENLP